MEINIRIVGLDCIIRMTKKKNRNLRQAFQTAVEVITETIFSNGNGVTFSTVQRGRTF